MGCSMRTFNALVGGRQRHSDDILIPTRHIDSDSVDTSSLEDLLPSVRYGHRRHCYGPPNLSKNKKKKKTKHTTEPLTPSCCSGYVSIIKAYYLGQLSFQHLEPVLCTYTMLLSPIYSLKSCARVFPTYRELCAVPLWQYKG